ncbi:hypothetical protein T069G_08079 [Trichoderma breve]|uniref:Uncharacterized protein n=1 Tax=Trichoderma breve TaxID=2034170 RepID=A0A9W9E5C4_9HYPO|nr:hypothetical protein T069G_08079 [Trichoderma breve]KAJ4857182.1 hypothetical protein T069G_08079 [Trichoderma breve]
MDLEPIAIPERSVRGPRDISPSSSSPSSCRTLSLESRSSASTKPSSRGASPAIEKEKSNGARSRSRRNPKQTTPFWNLMFRPRSYEEIYAERAYLTTSLHVCSVKVMELIHRYALTEEVLQAKEHPGKERRKLRKQMSFIKVKFSEASHQEKAIVMRLSELHMEQLGRDAWDQIHQRRMLDSNFSSNTAMPSNSLETPLSATSKEFVPSASPPVRAQCYASEVEKPWTLDTVVEDKEEEEHDDDDDDESLEEDDIPNDDEEEEVVTEAEGHTGDEGLCNHGLWFTYQGYSDAENIQLSSSHLIERLSLCAGERRKSLPSLCSIWPIAEGRG